MSMNMVTLADILYGQHLPPLTLGEFEDHLIYQRSAENLYFYFWLTDYTTRYRSWEVSLINNDLLVDEKELGRPKTMDSMNPKADGAAGVITPGASNFVVGLLQSLLPTRANFHQASNVELSNIPLSPFVNQPTKPTLPRDLEKCFERVYLTFIPTHSTPSSSNISVLELNLSQELKEKFKRDAQFSKDPSIFLSIKKEVITMLSDSLRLWLIDCSGNADRHRVRVTLGIGAAYVTMATVGSTVLMIRFNTSHVRLCLTPFFWLGTNIFFCGLYRTCPLLFLFGSYRQPHVWEYLRAERNATLTNEKLESGVRAHSYSASVDSFDENVDQGTRQPTGHQRISQIVNSDPSALLSFWDSQLQQPTLMTSNSSKIGPLPHIAITTEHFSRYDFPKRSPRQSHKVEKSGHQLSYQDLTQISTPIFGPLTKILSPIALRSQHLRMIKSALLASACTVCWILAWTFLPSN